MTKNRPAATRPSRRSPVRDVTRSRHIAAITRVLLAVRAGGRCQFGNHNKYLFRHGLTFTEGNFAEAAHIVAFRPRGPRGRAARLTKTQINAVANLMLLCPDCHTLIDRSPDSHSVTELRMRKQHHEQRILVQTAAGPEQMTRLVALTATIDRRPINLSVPKLLEAIAPRWADPCVGLFIDLTSLDVASRTSFYRQATAVIDQELSRFYQTSLDQTPLAHLSVVGLAPMPLLMYFGSRLSDKVSTDLFQRHRNGSWRWRKRGPRLRFIPRAVRTGTDAGRVALVLSLSGAVQFHRLPPALDERFTVYELTVESPTPVLLRTRADLEAFQEAYLTQLAKISRAHPHARELHVIPAVPAPAAITCGRALFSRASPPLVVYDLDETGGHYIQTLRIRP
jgi:hypothetical protein